VRLRLLPAILSFNGEKKRTMFVGDRHTLRVKLKKKRLGLAFER
jgi:hypothetical protein